MRLAFPGFETRRASLLDRGLKSRYTSTQGFHIQKIANNTEVEFIAQRPIACAGWRSAKTHIRMRVLAAETLPTDNEETPITSPQ
jgi:hypothetical protein